VSPGRLLAVLSGFKNRDEGQGRKRQVLVDAAKHRRESVQRDNLPEAETSSLEHLAVQPPGRPTGAIEEDRLLHPEPRLLRELLKRRGRVATPVTQNLVERALDLRAMRNQHDGPTIGREDPSNVLQRNRPTERWQWGTGVAVGSTGTVAFSV